MSSALDRRVSTLEREHVQLAAAVQRIEIEQQNAREVLKSRFEALNSGQQLLLARLESLQATISTHAADAMNTPAGKQALREIDDLKRRQEDLRQAAEVRDTRLLDLETFRQECQGAFKLANWLGAVSLAGAAAALVKAFLP